MKVKKEPKLIKSIIYFRSLLAVELIVNPNKKECLERILQIEVLPEEEIKTWSKLKEIYSMSENITKADIINLFGFNHLDNEILDKLLAYDKDDEFDAYLSGYEKSLKGYRLSKKLKKN